MKKLFALKVITMTWAFTGAVIVFVLLLDAFVPGGMY